jgi:hypothetical protein
LSKHPRARRAFFIVAAGLVAGFATSPLSLVRAAGPYGGTAKNGFTAPVAIPASGGLGEPTIVRDSGAGNGGVARLFVTAPQSLGNVMTSGGSPMFTSLDGGAHWSAPVRSQECAGLSGGDTDLGTDAGDNVYQTDLWLGNSCLSVSTDHGQSFAAGNPFGSELQPGDDRPWIAYNKLENQLYMTYDGLDALHVTNTAPLTNPMLGIQTINDNVVVPETAVNSGSTPDSVRECVCPPGGIAADNSSGSHAGRVYVSYSYQHGTAISFSDPTCTPASCTTATWTGPILIPNSGSSGSAFENEWNFDPIKVDSKGTVYVMWGTAPGFNATNNVAPHGVTIQFASSADGGNHWKGPFTLSTTTQTNTFPTMDVVGPGKLRFAYEGAPGATGDPNATSSSQQWNVYYGTVTKANTGTPTISTPVVAIRDMHNGCIQTGGGAACTDRSLLDFFTLTTDLSGIANIIYTGGDVTNGVQLYFTKR